MKVAIVHDYLVQAGGAERVVEVLHSIFPNAPIYTAILDESRLLDGLKDAEINVTWMQKIPGIKKNFKKFFMLYPSAVKSMDLTEYDLIITSSSAYAKGITKRKDAVQICYCYTPMRFAWDYEFYVERENFNPVIKRILPFFIKRLKSWDIRTNANVDYFIAISTEIKKRIWKTYHRDSDIIFPPVDTRRFKISEETDDYFLIVSRLVSYKRIDLVIKAFNNLQDKLIIIGEGTAKENLQNLIKGNNIELKGRLSDEEVTKYLSRCKALIFPGKEDFGITPLEANASGRPVIAFKDAGALDTVIDGKTGVFFDDISEKSLIEAVNKIKGMDFDKSILRNHAEKFSIEIYKENIVNYICDKTGMSRQDIL